MLIEIWKMPPGAAPPKIRQAWIGIKLPTIGQEEMKPTLVGTRRIGTANLGGYVVRAPVAMECLKIHAPQAFEWWAKNFPVLLQDGQLIFHADVCRETPD